MSPSITNGIRGILPNNVSRVLILTNGNQESTKAVMSQIQVLSKRHNNIQFAVGISSNSTNLNNNQVQIIYNPTQSGTSPLNINYVVPFQTPLIPTPPIVPPTTSSPTPTFR